MHTHVRLYMFMCPRLEVHPGAGVISGSELCGDGMEAWLGELTALTEDLDSVPNTCLRWLTRMRTY